MDKKSILIAVLLDLLIIFSCAIGGAAESSADYYSIHEESVSVDYSAYTLSKPEDPSSSIITVPESKSFKGFLNLYNLNDSIISCNEEGNPVGCPALDEKLWLPSIFWGTAGVNPPIIGTPRFRMFVPPGTIQITLYMYTQYQPSVKVAVRFRQPPECINCTSSQTQFTQESTFMFEKFETEDVHLVNAGGHIDIYSKSLQAAPDAFTDPLPIEQGGWLYVYVYDQAYAVGQIQCAIKVNTTKYMEWFDNYDYIEDSYGLNLGSTTIPNTLKGQVKDKATGAAVADVNLYAFNYSNLKIYSAKTDADGKYLINPLLNGDYLLFTQSPGGQIFVSSKTSDIYSLKNGTLQTVDFDYDSQASFSISNQTFSDGIDYCKANPEKCGIINVTDDFDVQLKYVKIPNITGRYDIGFKYQQADSNWTLDSYPPSNVQTQNEQILGTTIALSGKGAAGSNVLKGTLTDKSSGSLADISIYAIDFEHEKVFSATTIDPNTGFYSFDNLSDGKYFLIFGQSAPGLKFYVFNKTADLYSLSNGAEQTVNFVFDSSISGNGSQTYADGKQYCAEHPEIFDLINVSNSLGVYLKSLKIPSVPDRYDIDFNFIGSQSAQIYWEIGTVSPSGVQ